MAYNYKLENSVNNFGLIEKPVYGKLNGIIDLINKMISFIKTHTHSGNTDDLSDGNKLGRGSIDITTFNAVGITGPGFVPAPVGTGNTAGRAVVIWTGNSCSEMGVGWSAAKNINGTPWGDERVYIRAVGEGAGNNTNEFGGSNSHTHDITHTHTYSTDEHAESHRHYHNPPDWIWQYVSGSDGGSGHTPDGADDHYHFLTMRLLTGTATHSHTVSISSTDNTSVTDESTVRYRIVLFCQKD